MNSAEHTLNTLRYADRVKELKKKPRASGRGRREVVSDEADSSEAGDNDDDSSSLEDDGGGSDDLPFQTDDEFGVNGVDGIVLDDGRKEDEMWNKSRRVIEAHSKSVDKLLSILRLEEGLLRDLLNDQASLGEYYGRLDGLLSQRMEETLIVYKLLRNEEGK
jgi:hypothetical protein